MRNIRPNIGFPSRALPAPQKNTLSGALVAQEEGDWLSPKRRTAVILRSSSSLPLRRRSREPPLIRVFFKDSSCPTKKAPFRVLLWRRKRDSNPRGVSPKRFSRPPRYDRFDIPAYYIIKFLHKPIPNGLTLARLAIPSLSLLTRLSSL